MSFDPKSFIESVRNSGDSAPTQESAPAEQQEVSQESAETAPANVQSEQTEETQPQGAQEVAQDKPQPIDIESIIKEKTKGKFESLDSLLEVASSIPDDPYIKGAIDYYRQHGTLDPYLEAKSVNFDELSDEEVIKRDLRSKYPELPNELLEHYYEQTVVEKYKLDPDKYDERDVQLGKELLKAEASKMREEQKKQLEEFLKNSDPEQKQAAMREEWMKQVEQAEAIKSLSESKIVAFRQEGLPEFNYEVNPDSIKEMTIDQNKFFQKFVNDNGDLDWSKWLKVAAYASDPEGFERKFYQHGFSHGNGSVVDELKNKNVEVASAKTPNVENLSPLEKAIKAIHEQAKRR